MTTCPKQNCNSCLRSCSNPEKQAFYDAGSTVEKYFRL